MKNWYRILALSISTVAVTASGMSMLKDIPAYFRYHYLPASWNPATWFNNNFHTVIENEVYRSKTLYESALAKILDDKKINIKTILNLREGFGLWFQKEKELTARKGVELITITLDGNALPTKEQIRQIYEVLTQKAKPILIHCAAGADRTGLACAIAKMIYGDEPLNVLSQQTPRYCHWEWRYPLMRKCTGALLRAQVEHPEWTIEQIIENYDHNAELARIKETLPSMPMRMIYALGGTIKENKKVALAIGGLATLAAAALYAHKNGKLMPAVSAVKNKIFSNSKAPSSAPDEIDDPPSFA